MSIVIVKAGTNVSHLNPEGHQRNASRSDEQRPESHTATRPDQLPPGPFVLPRLQTQVAHGRSVGRVERVHRNDPFGHCVRRIIGYPAATRFIRGSGSVDYLPILRQFAAHDRGSGHRHFVVDGQRHRAAG